MRYAGQGYELRVELPQGEVDEAFLEAARKGFEEAYRAAYGYTDPNGVIEGIDWHLMASIPNAKPTQLGQRVATEEGSAIRGTRMAYFPEAGGYLEAAVIDRYRIRPGQQFHGPALVEERESTTVVLPGDIVSVTDSGHLSIEINVALAQEAAQ